MADDRLADELVRLCEKARSGGLLQLRGDADEAEVLAAGLRCVVRGERPEVVRAAMERKIDEVDPQDPAPLRRLIVGVLAVQRGDRPAELRALLAGG